MPNVFATNTTSSSITVAGHKVYYIDSTDAEIVEVQDGNNVKYNAFKYLLSGNPYWYVVDGEHDTWTDDLSAWGYSEVPVGPVLPEVTTGDMWLVLGAEAGSAAGSNVIISENAIRAGCWWDDGSGSYIASVYDSSAVYAIVRAAKTPWAVVARAGLPVENVGGAIGVRNLTGASITVYQAEYAYCDNLSAIVVTVYDANNVAYNAFKFTADGTDYYYVLDGTQTDWTDDLAGIGYSLTPNYLKGYINSSKGDSYVSRYSEKNLYDDTGNLIIGDSSKTYTIIGVYTANGGSVSYSNASLYAYENRLKFVWNDSNAYIAYIEYTVS